MMSPLFFLLCGTVLSFVIPPTLVRQQSPGHFPLFVATDDDMLLDDAMLLEQLPKQQFEELCQHLDLETSGTKEELLQRLRQHAADEAERDKQHKLNRVTRVRQGVGDVSKERYELADNDDEEGEYSVEDEGFFYFALPETGESKSTTKKVKKGAESKASSKVSSSSSSTEESTATKKPKKTMQNVITAPPPPAEPNEKGERVVTVYSTTETNDLTGATAAAPGGDKSILMEGEDSSSEQWDMGSKQNKKVPVELQDAKDTVDELVRSLLLLGGAPAFREEFTEGLQPLENKKLGTTVAPSMEFRGFDASLVPAELLLASSKSLRAGRGSVLQDVLHDVELRAIGHDGMSGDNIEKGGGHYQEVSKVRAFLEGFRRAELRRISRETTTMLLDKVATEGVQGLDRMLSTMTKTQDDSGDAGELSDALLDFLNDMVREQETRVGETSRVVDRAPNASTMEAEDALDKLWGVETEDGERVETLDPKDPKVIKALTEHAKAQELANSQHARPALPIAPPKQLLLLLKLLRDRLKAEAAFGNEDHGRNLRILAYCLRFERAMDREKLLRSEFQSSVDRLDDFLELVTMSMEYAESTTAQLQPTSVTLNHKLLGDVRSLGRSIREQIAATGEM